MNNTSIIDPNTSIQTNNIPDDFLALFEISAEMRKKMKGLSLGLIIVEMSLGFIKLTFSDRTLSFKFECVSKDKMEILIKRKKGSYDQVVKNIFLPTVEAGFSLLSCGGGYFKIASSTVSILTRGATGHLESMQQCDLAGIQHEYESHNQLKDQYRRKLQENRDTFEGTLNTMTKVADASQEAFRTIAAPAA
jgi:hypothetical protein